MARLVAVQSALLLLACGLGHAQGDEPAPTLAELEASARLWLPAPPKFPDHPMTEAEFAACMRQSGPRRGPHKPPASETPPASRCLLEERVSADVNGSVVDVVKALMGHSKREWLVSVRGDSAEKTAQFTATDAPLWQALDKLLEAYGYDWGFSHGAVVCWPALIPARPRPETPRAIPAADDVVLAEPPIEIGTPTWVGDALEPYRPTRGYIELRPAVDARLRDWKLVGRSAGDDCARGIQQMAAALTAVVEGSPDEGCLCMGAHMWLDRALRGADARAAELKARGIDLAYRSRGAIPLKDAIRALLSPQQWRLVEIGGGALIWFREVPLDVAELWVVTAKVRESQWVKQAPEGQDWSVDWSRPDEFCAIASRSQEVEPSPVDGLFRVVGYHVGINVTVMKKDGIGIGF
jgi:hypothetical protein